MTNADKIVLRLRLWSDEMIRRVSVEKSTEPTSEIESVGQKLSKLLTKTADEIENLCNKSSKVQDN